MNRSVMIKSARCAAWIRSPAPPSRASATSCPARSSRARKLCRIPASSSMIKIRAIPTPSGADPAGWIRPLRGQREPKRAPLPDRAVHADSPAVRFDRELAEGQPQAGRAVEPAARGFHLSELLEDLLVILRGDPGAGVRDRHLHPVAIGCHANLHLTSL